MYFMRHGQSEFNVRCEATGIAPDDMSDAPLTDLGKEQACAAGQRIKGDGFVRVVASPFTRAIQTASIVAGELGLSVEVEPLLGEHRMYSCDLGTPASELRAAWPQVDFKDFDSEDWWLPYPEGRASLDSRIIKLEDKWRQHKDWGKILFVSHYHFINGITGATPDNTEIVRWQG